MQTTFNILGAFVATQNCLPGKERQERLTNPFACKHKWNEAQGLIQAASTMKETSQNAESAQKCLSLPCSLCNKSQPKEGWCDFTETVPEINVKHTPTVRNVERK